MPFFRRKPVADSYPRGFTLLELLVVIAVIGIALALVYPRLPALGAAYLKTDAGRAAGLLVYLNEASAARRTNYRLKFDLEKETLTVDASKGAEEYAAVTEPGLGGIKFREGVDLEDIVVPGLGRVKAGEVSVVIAPSGSGEPFTLHLKSGKEQMTILFNPYSGKALIEKGYI